MTAAAAAAPKAPYSPANPGFGFTDVPENEFDYPFPGGQ